MDLQAIKNRFGIIGNSNGLNHALNIAVQVANTDLSVLINGESGVGKEIFSQIIHTLSARKHNPFIAVNCGAIPEGTIDSELFGHEKGSFTGAFDNRKGYFETVSGGTIFLDEIGEMPLGTQARLLRVLETGEYIRVGSSKVQKTDVRVIAATNRELLQQTQRGRFREDLYYRLNTVPIKVPALRERPDDIYLLFRKFASDFADKYRTTPVMLNDDAQHLLKNYSFRGNVRELKNVTEQISVLSKSKQLSAKDLQIFIPEENKQNNLPVLASNSNNNQEFNSERDILYKLFFDMKKDVSELKKILFDIIQHNKIGVDINEEFANNLLSGENKNFAGLGNKPNVFVNPNANNSIEIQQHEPVIEESLSLIDKEKEFIIKALKKHKGRRKEASSELGISERSLYRKIKEFKLEDL